jgi:hypothetical protein
VLGRAREALLGAAHALHDGGHVLGAVRLGQAGLQLGQRGLQAAGLGGVDGAVLLLPRGRVAVQQHMALRVQHAL